MNWVGHECWRGQLVGKCCGQRASWLQYNQGVDAWGHWVKEQRHGEQVRVVEQEAQGEAGADKSKHDQRGATAR